ncbi:sensor histidine kinase [Kitasatospora paranensis]
MSLFWSGAALGWLLVREALNRVAFGPRAAGPVAVAHFAGLLVLIAVLNLGNPVYGFLGLGGYLHTLLYLPRRAQAVGVALTACPVALSQVGGRIPDGRDAWFGYLAVLFFNLLVAGMLVAFGRVVEAQARHHRQAARELAQANARLAGTLAENAGLHAQLVQQAREAGATDERQRMAREIHDTVAQGLAGIVTQLQAAQHTAQPAARGRHLENAAALARESLVEARRAVAALGPRQLLDAELPAALEELVAGWGRLHGVAAELAVTGGPCPLHPEVEVALLRAAQESLANVAKHAAASRVRLTLSYMAGLVTLDVRDDGRGFDPAGVAGSADGRGGYGLAVMRERVQALAGRLEIESEPGGGTAVSAALPALAREERHG